MRILLICSVNPTIGPAHLSLDMKSAFEKAGHEVVLLTKYKVLGRTDIDYVLNSPSKKSSYLNRLKSFVFYHRQRTGYYFFYKKDTNPPVRTELIMNSINGGFDMIYILFWQGLISFETIDRLYERYHVPFIFSAADYSMMTGGCHFMHECRKYEQACGRCPGIRSIREKDFTWYNIEYRKKVYEKVKPVILTNSFNQQYFKRATLTKDSCYVNVPAIINENEFFPRDKANLRIKYQVPETKHNILFFGCQNLADKRKGMDLLLVALNELYDQMKEKERDATLIISAGKSDDRITKQIRFDVIDKGFVCFDTLADLYSLADVYLSPSVVDSGPMMVSQAIMCGTPVVAFKMGLALDVIQGKGSGYCAEVGNTLDFVEGIKKYLFEEDRVMVSNRCREVALATSSYEAYLKLIDKAFLFAKERQSNA